MRFAIACIAACSLALASTPALAAAPPGPGAGASPGACVACHTKAAPILGGAMATRASERAFARRAFGSHGERFFERPARVATSRVAKIATASRRTAPTGARLTTRAYAVTVATSSAGSTSGGRRARTTSATSGARRPTASATCRCCPTCTPSVA